jgi:hypothetical protein
MFYFFRRDEEYVRCEIRGAMDSMSDYELVIVEPSGEERIERYSSSADVHNRWLQVQQNFVHAGWWGPLGRE